MFVHTTAIKKLRKLKSRVRVIPGGTSAGKTFGIIPILIDTAAKTPNLEISIVSESIPHLRRGALRDFIKIMKATNRWVEKNYNRTFLIYNFSNGSYIEFFSAEDEAKVRGARRNILYINECNNIRFNTYHQLAIRTSSTVWLDFNPDNEFWAHTELMTDPDAEWLTLTFYDNEALDESLRNEILKAKEKAKTSAYWANWWKVYGLGQLGKLEGVIFDNWDQIEGVPPGSRLIGHTIDFGFTNDPTTITSAWQWEDKVIWDERVYETGMTNGDIAKRMKRLGIRATDFIVADSAEPKSIKEINEYGFKVRPAVKGRDSIRFGIDTLQENDFLVTSSSTNLIKELRQYAWATDKTGKSLNVPIDAFNHCFSSDTLVLTTSGQKRIVDIVEGDKVITSSGPQRVLKRWDNGCNKLFVYELDFGYFSIKIKCTKDHKFKTSNGWKQISDLEPKDRVYLSKGLMERFTDSIQGKDIFQEGVKNSTELFGSIQTGKSRKDLTYIILTKTQETILSKILKSGKKENIVGSTGRKGQKRIKNGSMVSTAKGSKRQKNGMPLRKVLNGIKNIMRNTGTSFTLKRNILARFVGRDSLLRKQGRDSVQIIARLLSGEGQGLMMKQESVSFVEKITGVINTQRSDSAITAVLQNIESHSESIENSYDLHVENCHEYFANGVLVSNCIDGMRYLATAKISRQKKKRKGPRRRN